MSCRNLPLSILVTILAATGFTLPEATCADDALIPADGSWVQYQLTYHSKNASGADEESKFTRKLSLVGTATEDGETHRWLEVATIISEPPEIAGTHYGKLLIPEAGLFKSSNPYARMRRIWVQSPNQPARRMEPEKYSSRERELDVLLWTPGMLKNAKALENESRVIEFQNGKLTCTQAYSGKREFGIPVGRTGQMPVIENATIWLHPKLPLGFAEARIDTIPVNEKDSMSRLLKIYRLQDFGSDAKTDLPDCN